MNLIEALRHHSRMRPFDLAVIHPGGAANYLQLATTVARLSAKLRSHGIRPGGAVAIYTNEPFLHLALVLAAMADEVATVSAHPNHDPLPAGARIDAYLAEKALPFTPASGKVIAVDNTWLEGGDATAAMLGAGFRDPHVPCRYYASSGTTGIAKLIAHTSARQEAMALRNLMLDPQGSGPNLCMMWLSAIGGWSTTQMTLMHGATLVMATTPLNVLRATNLYKVRMLRASPQQLQVLVEMVRGQPVRFPSLEKVEVGGASLPPAVLLGARALLCPNVVGIYGSTEASLVAQAPASLLQAVPDAAGYVLPDVEVRICDAQGRVVDHGVEGVVQLRSPVLADGYVGDAAATAAAFHDGWFSPGDLGVLRQDGLLRITGRTDEMINAGGVKVNPVLVDEFLMAQPGIADAAAFAFRRTGHHDQIWAAVVPKEGYDEKALLAAGVERLNSRAPVKLVKVPEIPRNAMGKALRQKLSEDALRH